MQISYGTEVLTGVLPLPTCSEGTCQKHLKLSHFVLNNSVSSNQVSRNFTYFGLIAINLSNVSVSSVRVDYLFYILPAFCNFARYVRQILNGS